MSRFPPFRTLDISFSNRCPLRCGHCMFAADMHAGISGIDAQEIAQSLSAFDARLLLATVDRHFDFVFAHAARLVLRASSSVRANMRRPTTRRYSAVARRSSKGAVSSTASVANACTSRSAMG